MQDKISILSVSTIPTINIYRKTSMAPGEAIEGKRFNIPFHTLEPLGIEILYSTNISILVSGDNIKGKADLYYHNVDNVQRVDTINVNEVKTVTIPGKGGLLLNIANVLNNLGDAPFSFQVTININNTNAYIITPTFDIRSNKIHNSTIINEADYNQALANNEENGMLMISDNVRIFMPKCKYIKLPISPSVVLALHEQTLSEHNKIAGLDINAANQLDRPRRNFILVSSRNQQAGYMSAGGTMLDTAPKFSMEYINGSWGMFHEYGHLYDQPWVHVEIWTNMYSKNMEEKTTGFKWLWGNDRAAFENKVLRSFYENYLVKGLFTSINLNFDNGLYLFITLEEILGKNFATSITSYYRDNDISLIQQDYIAYAIAKLYGINVIPYLELYGLIKFNNKVIDFVVDNSNSTLVYVPNNPLFLKYNNISITPIAKSIYTGTNPQIVGISKSNAKINLTVNTSKYNFNADNMGKFVFTIPQVVNESSTIKINSTETGKTVSQTRTILVGNLLSDNKFNFYGLGGSLIATIEFDVKNKVIVVSSTGLQAHSYFGDKVYFSTALYDNNKKLIATSSVKGNSNANDFAKNLTNKTFTYGYYIQVTHLEPSRLVLDGIFKNSPSTTIPFNFNNIDLTKCNFVLQNTGIVYQNFLSNNIFKFNGLGSYLIATIEFDIFYKVLSVKSTGKQSHSYFGDQVYFSAALYDSNKKLIATSSVKGNSNADLFANTLNKRPFDYGYYIKITHKESNILSLDGTILTPPNNNLPLTFGGIDLSRVTFYIQNNGIKYSFV